MSIYVFIYRTSQITDHRTYIYIYMLGKGLKNRIKVSKSTHLIYAMIFEIIERNRFN